MSRFENIIDDVIDKAKIAADVAGKKTTEILETSKIKYRMKQIHWDIEKSYAKLGALYYESQKTNDNFDDVMDVVMAEIDDLNNRLDDLEDDYDDARKDYTQQYRERPRTNKNNVDDDYVEVNGDDVFDDEEDLKQAIQEVEDDIFESSIED